MSFLSRSDTAAPDGDAARPEDRARRRWFLVAAALALALTLPSLFDGFILDDVLILSILEEWYPERSHPFDVYENLVDRINRPWWASREVSISFFRPFSSALLRLDHAVFGRASVAWKIHSMLWLVALLLVVKRLYRRLPVHLAGLALVFFAVDEAHGYTAGWISNRHGMVATALGALGVAAHIAWRRQGSRPALALSVAAFVAALASGEMAIAMLGFALAFELVASPGGWRDKAVGMIPLFTLAGAFVVTYKALGKGSAGVGAYVDPTTEPVRYVLTALERVPIMLGGALLGPPPDMAAVPHLHWPLVAVGVLAIGLFGVFAWRHFTRVDAGERRELGWLLLGALFSLVPLVATLPGHRQLLPTMIGLAPLVAAAVLALWRVASPSWRVAARVAAVLLLVIHLPGAAAGRLFMQYGLGDMHRSLDAILAEMGPFSENERVLMLRAPDIATVLYGPVLYDYRTGEPRERTWTFFSAAPVSLRLERSEPRRVDVEAEDGEMIASVFENFWPPAEPIEVGDRFEAEMFSVEVTATGESGATALAFHLPDGETVLGDTRVYSWRDGQLEEVPFLGVQEVRRVPHSPSPVALPGT